MQFDWKFTKINGEANHKPSMSFEETNFICKDGEFGGPW